MKKKKFIKKRIKMVEYFEMKIQTEIIDRYIIFRKSKNENIVKNIQEEWNRERRIYEKTYECDGVIMSNKGVKKLLYGLIKKQIKEDENSEMDVFIEINLKNDDKCIYSEDYCFFEEEITKEKGEEIKESIDDVFELYEEVRINQNDIKKIMIENTKNEITKTFPPEIINMIINYM